MAYALVTGAAKGIGRAIAFELAKRSYDLLLVDKAEPELTNVAGEIERNFPIQVHLLLLDLSTVEATKQIMAWSKRYFADLTVVVNNAGFGVNGHFSEIPIDEHMELINVNIKTVVELSHAFIPVLSQQKRGYLLNVGSTTAYQPVPYVTIYAASKAFVVAFTRSLRHELRHSNVSVTCLSPGSTDTDFVNRARMGPSIKKTAERFNMTPEAVAKIGIEALFSGKAEVVAGFLNKIGAFLPKFLPNSLVAKVVGNIYEPKN